MKYNKKVSFLQKGNRMGTTAGKSNAEIMAEARRNQAIEQGQQAQDAQAALARQNRGNAIASNRIQGNVPSVPVASSFRIPTTQDMRAHANPVRRTGGIPLRNRAVAATNVLTPRGGWGGVKLPTDSTGAFFSGSSIRDPRVISPARRQEIAYEVEAERNATKPPLSSYKKGGRLDSFQQGGTMEQGVSQEDLIMDFAIRYLTTMGVAEQDIMDQDGNVNPEYVEEITAAINEVDNPEFWEAYEQAPDELVMEYIESSNPGAVEMARKGAKLRVLNSLKYKTYR